MISTAAGTNSMANRERPYAGSATCPPTTVLWEDDETRLELTSCDSPSGTLAITFDPIGVLADRPAYAREFMRKCGVDTLAVRKKKENFYQPLPRQHFLQIAAPVMAHYRRCIAYGSSLGAYAVLYYCRDGFDMVVASSPRISAHPRFGNAYWQHRIEFQHEAFDPQQPCSSRAVIFYDPHDEVDNGLVTEEIAPAWPRARMVPLPFSGHPANHFLSEIGFIAPFMRSVVAGKQPVPPERTLKASSPSYLATLAAHCLRRNKARWARDLASRARDRLPRDITVARTLGLAELALGHAGEAADLLQSVAERFPHDSEAVDAARRAQALAARVPPDNTPPDNPAPRPARAAGAGDTAQDDSPAMTNVPPPAPEPGQAQSNPDSWQRMRRWAKTRAVGPASSVLSKVGLMVSRDDVLWCYRHLLGREPESEEAVLSHLRFRDFKALAQHFVDSVEYSGNRHDATDRRPAGTAPYGIGPEVFRAAIDQSLEGRPASRDRDVYIETHFDRLLHTINVIAELLPAGGRMIDFSAARFFSDAVRKLQPAVVQTSVTGVNFERDDYVERYGAGSYDLCLNTEVLEHLLFDPAHMIFSISRMLKRGGLLFLSTPNALAMANALQLMQGSAPTLWNQVKPDEPYYERHNRDWTPFEVVKILEEHGFDVLKVYTEDFYGSTIKLLRRQAQHAAYLRRHSSHDYFGDTMCVVARKRVPAAFPVRSPWLYAYHERHAPAVRVPAKKSSQQGARPKPDRVKDARSGKVAEGNNAERKRAAAGVDGKRIVPDGPQSVADTPRAVTAKKPAAKKAAHMRLGAVKARR